MVLKESDIIEHQRKPLSNLRIAITAVDLEQSEHRGIAHLSKSLISSLTKQGAEVYLLTGFRGQRLHPIMKLFMSKPKNFILIELIKINYLMIQVILIFPFPEAYLWKMGQQH